MGMRNCLGSYLGRLQGRKLGENGVVFTKKKEKWVLIYLCGRALASPLIASLKEFNDGYHGTRGIV